VVFATQRLGQPVQDHLADLAVIEAEALLRRAHDAVPAFEPLQQLERADARQLEHAGDRPGVEVLALDRGHLERVALLGSEAIQPVLDHVHHARRDGEILELALGGRHHLRHLEDEERIAFGLGEDALAEPRAGHVPGEEIVHHRRGRAAVEARELEQLDAFLAPEEPHHLAHRARSACGARPGIALGFFGTERTQQQHLLAARLGGGETEQMERAAVGPVEVVQHDQQRPAPRHRLERGDRRLPELIGATEVDGLARVELEQAPQAHGAGAGEVRLALEEVLEPFDEPEGRSVQCLAQHLPPRVVGRPTVEQRAAAHHPHVLLLAGPRQLGEQPRLADPRLARKQQRSAFACAHALQPRLELLEFRVASDQRRFETRAAARGGGGARGRRLGALRRFEQEQQVFGERDRVGMAVGRVLAERAAEELARAVVERHRVGLGRRRRLVEDARVAAPAAQEGVTP
jgi:hypothetical protein